MGIFLVAVFVGTGLYMRFVLDSASLDAVNRMALRANHIYLLLLGIIHFLSGLMRIEVDSGWQGYLQTTGSIMFFASSVLVLAGFFLEYEGSALIRPLTGMGLFAALAGGLIFVLLWFIDSKRHRA